MKVIYGIGKLKRIYKNASLAIGVFDGLHKGHQKLIKRAVKVARSNKGECLVMTFWPHPVKVLRPKEKISYIISLKHRLRIMEKLGVAKCIVVHFTKKFSHLSPHNFIKRYLADHIKPLHVFVGDDFRFGEHRKGTLELFREFGGKYGFKVDVVKALKGNHHKISSSDIRALIADGDLKGAERFLGRRVAVMGTVVRGDGRGKRLGFPTANIIPGELTIPPAGVYAVHVVVNEKRYKGMANIGRRPSFRSRRDDLVVETNIFNFKRLLYGRPIIIEFIGRLRDERAFDSPEKLSAQLVKDKKQALSLLKN